ncbi:MULTISPECIES: cell wall elongation regulator TseB-like domain-containing protein [Kurthia]|uniref:cell wall elongation regulator TseB-like domain-containing protein n=1 Tax=Kurthia TaxID=1649 RepID=UPI002549DA87|nr:MULTISPECIES: DUF5590 domain-containing protein [Kurthia]MEB7771950.1 DUF5590 domain-containing protein [Kurthia gibsonii]WIL39569.1 DUF5590 domain-containing protein [Kurthia sp. YJT4]
MKSWIKFFAIFFVMLAVVLTVLVTIKAYAPYHSATQEAKDVVLKERLLKTVDKSYVYNSTNHYVTVIGKNDKNQSTAVVLNQDQSKAKKEVIELSKGVTEKEAIKIATEGQKVKKVLHVHLGIEKPGPVWEVAFENNRDELNYVYVVFETGQWWKKITNL